LNIFKLAYMKVEPSLLFSIAILFSTQNKQLNLESKYNRGTISGYLAGTDKEIINKTFFSLIFISNGAFITVF